MTNKGFTDIGFDRMRYDEIIEMLHSQARKEWGDGINVNDNSPLGKFLNVIAYAYGEMWEVYERGYYQNYLLTAEGLGLDMWASNFGDSRRLGIKSKGEIEVTGTSGLRVPRGFRVSAGTDIIFETTEDVVINTKGVATVAIQAIAVGQEYNVIAKSIKNIVNPIVGVTRVINNEKTHGGTSVETDEELRERLLFKIRTPMTGDNKNQYIYWAKENEKVGAVKVLRAKPQPGYTTVLISNKDGSEASKELVGEVAEYIETVRSTTAGVVVDSLSAKEITIKAEGLIIKPSVSLEEVKIEIAKEINKYFASISGEGNDVSMAKVGHIVISNEGVEDYSKLTMNGLLSNIKLEDTEIPVIKDIVLEVK